MHVTEVESPLFADAAVAAAQLVIHVVHEGPLLTVFEENAHDAGSARHDRRHHLDHRSDPPLLVIRVLDAIAELEKKAFLFIEHVVTDGIAK